jgi:glycine/D-amino acid oxidase-like deaminating enzyme
VIGGGVVGTAAAAFLTGAGARVELWERDELAAAASGRNSGAVQHPYDPALAGLHAETVAIYRELPGLRFPPSAAGVLLLARERAPALAGLPPELEPRLLEGVELERAEPALGPGLGAWRLETGYPVEPAAATLALAALARERGAALTTGAEARPWIEDGTARGVLAGGERRSAGAVLVAAGPWTPSLVDIPDFLATVWGVNVEVALTDPPRHVLEEASVKEVAAAGGPETLFSLVTAAGRSALGSTFLLEEPDPATLTPALVERGAGFVPSLREARVAGARACPRPASLDGRPLLGPLPGVEGLWVAAGHGPWGISIGPGSARLVAGAMLGDGARIPPELAAARAA